MTTRNSKSSEKKQTSARDTPQPKPRIGVKEEPDIKSRQRRAQPADHEEKQSRVTCDPKPRTRQQEKLSARRRVEGLMKHVPDGRRKTARDGN